MTTGKLATYQDVAALAQVHPRTVQRWIKRLNLKVVRPTCCTVRLPAGTVARLLGWEVDYQPKKRPSR